MPKQNEIYQSYFYRFVLMASKPQIILCCFAGILFLWVLFIFASALILAFTTEQGVLNTLVTNAPCFLTSRDAFIIDHYAQLHIQSGFDLSKKLIYKKLNNDIVDFYFQLLLAVSVVYVFSVIVIRKRHSHIFSELSPLNARHYLYFGLIGLLFTGFVYFTNQQLVEVQTITRQQQYYFDRLLAFEAQLPFELVTKQPEDALLKLGLSSNLVKSCAFSNNIHYLKANERSYIANYF